MNYLGGKDRFMKTMTNWQIEQEFVRRGPFTHLYTSPLENGLLAEDDEDRKVIMNMIALVTREVNVKVLAYAIMSNHIHLMINGDVIQAKDFYEHLIARLTRYLMGKGKGALASQIHCGTTAVTSLKQFRNEIAYIIRNPFVVRNDINLFSYQWCSGYLYFNQFLCATRGKPASEIGYRERRLITRTSNTPIPDEFRVLNGLILPESFVDYKLVEILFADARQFLFCVLKNVEAQVEIALSRGELPHLSDDEMFQLSCNMCRKQYGAGSVKELDDTQRKELAVTLRNQYAASNGQLSRFTGLDLATINQMYPLSAKR